ncbi:hypothetical protein M431DRAFT_486889 [Trichoderma harzianum CBS 226.95]|uniref:Uncharacterized protein n=1 Tax=Trichoderma harzianum CBS 226.95 TaxID=983964 RepID=A0A2T3ZWR9_TRIHA|nr:hypothetical protein M431DRAFT_486889 [Trichoderma harzianum CBS 226.95]PTB49266.1 hypothetical protein M431DRAFT_486889 [Trichoderma harzianum CBS 226.95]
MHTESFLATRAGAAAAACAVLVRVYKCTWILPPSIQQGRTVQVTVREHRPPSRCRQHLRPVSGQSLRRAKQLAGAICRPPERQRSASTSSIVAWSYSSAPPATRLPVLSLHRNQFASATVAKVHRPSLASIAFRYVNAPLVRFASLPFVLTAGMAWEPVQ